MTIIKDIKEASASVQTFASSLAQKNRYYNRSITAATAGWRGKAGEAFKDSGLRTKRYADSIVNGYEDLYAKTQRLADSVRKAETEESASTSSNYQFKHR